jgi:hypothetical protein
MRRTIPQTIPKRKAKPSLATAEQVDVVVSPLKPEVYPTGLTKRDYFAAVAMQGILCQHVQYKNEDLKYHAYQGEPKLKTPWKNGGGSEEVCLIVSSAVDIADALVAELERKAPKK